MIPTYFPAVRYGGTIYATHALCKALGARGLNVEVYTTNVSGDKNETMAPQRTEVDGVIVNYFASDRLQRLSWAPGLSRQLRREIHRFDIVHLHTTFLWPTWAAARIARQSYVPYVLSPRGMLVKNLIRSRNWFVKTAWIELIEKTNVRCAAAIHATSKLEAQDLGQFGWKLPPVVTIPNGVDEEVQAGSVSEDVMAATSHRPYALFLGRLTWKKGLDRLLLAFARTTCGDLVIAGTDDEQMSKSLRSQSIALGITERVQILPRTVSGADKNRLYHSARVFVLPSRSENFGNTVLEAMMSGVPVLLTPEVGAAEIAIDAGGGVVVDGAPEAFGAALELFLVDENFAGEVGERGRRYVVQNCTWDSVSARMEAMYRGAIADTEKRVFRA